MEIRARVRMVHLARIPGRQRLTRNPPLNLTRRSRLIPLAVAARHERFPDEASYRYAPLAAERIEADEDAMAGVLRNYNRWDIGI